MILDEPYNSWLVKNVGENIDENTRFVVKVDAVTSEGSVPLSVDFDLAWFILLHSTDTEQIKLDVALALLKKPGYLAQFHATLLIHGAKRLLAEFLLFNPVICEGLKGYIDFTLLNVPIDFISHALLVKRSNDLVETIEVVNQRLQTVNLVLDTGFKLTGDVPPKSVGVAVHKVLLMDIGDQKFTLTKRLLDAGFQLFSEIPAQNNEVAMMLIDNRSNNDCIEMIKANAPIFKTLVFQVAGSTGSNIADYYYWVREDMKAVDFMRSTLNLDITP
ncbi:MAG TPA: hypothetical protein VLG38_02865 [Gammaproteobacteria bacterium]|nr:hypothetical protein [Gammaproteobacteria bacterium]